jgi:hypothetical protein
MDALYQAREEVIDQVEDGFGIERSGEAREVDSIGEENRDLASLTSQALLIVEDPLGNDGGDVASQAANLLLSPRQLAL